MIKQPVGDAVTDPAGVVAQLQESARIHSRLPDQLKREYTPEKAMELAENIVSALNRSRKLPILAQIVSKRSDGTIVVEIGPDRAES